MCGIAGIVAVGDAAPPVDAALLERMREIIAHRGPDDAGSYCSPDGRAGLASRRLSIIDLSSAGHMPKPNDDDGLWIAYNGEVYNFAEHRPMLEARGHVFRSRSDTEVILRLYQEFGPDCVHYLRGMFALAIWDARKGELFLARDRLGIKPLYYAFAGGQFLFSSEIKSLLLHPSLSPAVDDEGFYHFLTFLTTPPPHTLFQGIFKLPAGHRATLGPDGRLRVEEYWDVFDSARVEPGLSEEDYAERLLAELRQSVRLRMVSDVPFGVLLSGGIDSSVNTALMAELMDSLSMRAGWLAASALTTTKRSSVRTISLIFCRALSSTRTNPSPTRFACQCITSANWPATTAPLCCRWVRAAMSCSAAIATG
jgi:asparagine synthase (glutamine-hydrolysing)